MVTMTQKFTDLSEPQRRHVLAWANSHDWGAGKARWIINDGIWSLRVACACFAADNTPDVEIFFANTMRELRDWAGY